MSKEEKGFDFWYDRAMWILIFVGLSAVMVGGIAMMTISLINLWTLTHH